MAALDNPNNIFTVEVRDIDSNIVTGAFTATIAHVDEAITGGGDLGTQSATENAAFSHDISSSFTDPDGHAITYAITGGNVADLFMIDENCGVVAFKDTGPYITVDSDYVLSITATDDDDTPSMATGTLTVTVTNDTEDDPSGIRIDLTADLGTATEVMDGTKEVRGFHITGAAGDQLGTSNSGYIAGDIDADGKDDLVLGAVGNEKAYVFLNDKLGANFVVASDALASHVISGAATSQRGISRALEILMAMVVLIFWWAKARLPVLRASPH